MGAIYELFTRCSIREFTEQPIESEKLHQILDAAMSGPCCLNERDCSFVAVTEKAKLQKMAEANGNPARPPKNAAAGSLVCGDLAQAFPPAKDYWIVDGTTAAEIISAYVLMRWGSVRYGSAHGRKWIGCSASGSFLICPIP